VLRVPFSESRSRKKKMKCLIGLTYDLRADYAGCGLLDEDLAEFDSEETIGAIDAALRQLGHQTVRIGHGRALCRRLVAGERWDLVFNIAEGLRGRCREAQVPALLELYDMPYTFSDPMVCAVTLDKETTKRLVRAGGIRTTPSFLVRDRNDIGRMDLPFPVFVKPVAEGTGKGIDGRNRIATNDELRKTVDRLLAHYRQPILVEAYLPGREFTVGLLGNGRSSRVLGSLEIRSRYGAPHMDYSFEMKERCEEYVDYLPVRPGALLEQIERLALDAYRCLDVRDAGRVDIRLDDRGRPSFLEINPLPGLHPTHSDLPMIATAKGLAFHDLIRAIVTSALERLEVHRGSCC